MISKAAFTAMALAAGVCAASSSSSSGSSGPTSTSKVLSFAYPAALSMASAYTPTSGVSAHIYGVDGSSRTTLAFTCPPLSHGATVGALCPESTNTPIAVTVGPDYFAWDWWREYQPEYFEPMTTLASEGRVEGEMHCAVTSTKTKASPVCTMNITSIASALPTVAVLEDIRCFEEDVAGPASGLTAGVYNTLSVGSCKSSISAKPTTAYTVTRNPSDMVYWTVTVTEVAAGVTLKPSSSVRSFGVSLSAAAVVGLTAVILAL